MTGTTEPVSAHAAAADRSRSNALTTRYLDFWLLGGASVVVWLVMFTLDGFRTRWAIDEHFRHLSSTALSLSLLINYPHFAASYRLAYTRGRSFVVGYWWQLIAVPVGLVALFTAAYLYYDLRVEELSPVVSATAALTGLGVNAQVLGGPRLGDLLFTLAFNLMFLTLGWHYTKQVYGCMMVYAHFDRYPLTKAQRTLTRWALLSVWVMVFIDYNLAGDFRGFRGFAYSTLDLPDIAGPVSQAFAIGGLLVVSYLVFYRNYRVTGRRPSLTMLVPLVALYLWWLPQTRQEEFFFLLVPLFHGMQYLAFAYKMEDGHLRGAPHREAWGTAIVAGLVLGGWLAFEFAPDALDTWLGTFQTWQMFFFFTAAMLFINIHHYFIDNVLWRLGDSRVRAYLLDERE
jgi:hypothetical protein